MKLSIIDIAGMEEDGMKDMKQFIYDHGQSGDLLRLSVSIPQNDGNIIKEIISAEFVGDGEQHDITDKNLLLPFQNDIATVTIGSQIVSYDPLSESIFVDGVQRNIGDNFMLDGRNVSIAKGSIVIIIEDSLVKAFPKNDIQDEIISNTGSISIGDIVTTNTYLIERKEISGDTSVSSYIYFRDTITDERICGLEHVRTVDDGVISSTSNIKLSHTDSSNVKTTQNVLEYGSINTTIRSLTQVLDENTVTIDQTGISIGSDSASLILGENSEFGIFYEESTDTLHIKHLDINTGEYVTKREFSN